MQHWRAFSKDWFANNQSKLQFAMKSKWFRDTIELDHYEPGTIIVPNGVHIPDLNGKHHFIAHSHDIYSKRLYHRFKPVWWAMHGLDWLILDRQSLIPNFGFATLTAYPDADAETDTFDGWVAVENIGVIYGDTWDMVHDATFGDGFADDSSEDYAVKVYVEQAAPLYTVGIVRSEFTFDTSGLTSSATVSAATFTIHVTATISDNSGGINVYASAPKNATSVDADDYGLFGTTAFSTAKSISGISTVQNDFSLNSSGIAAISKTGITKLGLRESTYDVADSAPSEPADRVSYEESVSIYYADYTGTTYDPVLEITYSLPSSILPAQRIIVVN